MNSPALVLMARAPEAGKVKTRMQPSLSPEQCASLYVAFLGDAIDLCMSMAGVAHFVAFTPVESRPIFERIVSPGMELITQAGGDLGAVMDSLMKVLMGRKYSPVLLIGSDIPALQPRALRRAIETLKDHDLCLGPSRDGGYYLIGAGKPVSSVFQGIPWSTSGVLRLTQEKAASSGLRTVLLEELEDADTAGNLWSLEKNILRLRNEPGACIPMRTEAWIKNCLGGSGLP